MPKGKSKEKAEPKAQTAEKIAPKAQTAPKRKKRRRRQKNKNEPLPAFLLISPKAKKPKGLKAVGAALSKVTSLVSRGIDPAAIGLYQRKKVKLQVKTTVKF